MVQLETEKSYFIETMWNAIEKSKVSKMKRGTKCIYFNELVISGDCLKVIWHGIKCEQIGTFFIQILNLYL